jgi:molybdopterin-guanine dinucleotide biosynthesis protein A
MEASAVILAGGQSSRMGRDKAWVEAAGQPLIRRALETVRAAGITEIFISGRAEGDYSALGCQVLLDRERGLGPVAGIERALDAAQAPFLLVLAVDLPGMTAAFLGKLIQQCRPLAGAVPRLDGGLEPLAAIYPRRCLAIARDCLGRDQRCACGFAEACVRERAVRLFPVDSTDAACFENWNHPADVRGLPGVAP